jgi:predicted DsbA family dithiol-disulfide isomerase
MAKTPVLLYSDFTCPFSYVTEAALRLLSTAGSDAEVGYCAFELYPAPAPLPAFAIDDRVSEALLPLAVEAGVRLTGPAFLPRTRKAHEAACFAREHGREPAMRAAIFRAYWQDGRDIGRIDALVSLAEAVGLVAEEMKIALDIDAFADDVQRDRATAERMGIQQTPTLIIGSDAEARVIVGAHPLADLRSLLGPPPADSGPET